MLWVGSSPPGSLPVPTLSPFPRVRCFWAESSAGREGLLSLLSLHFGCVSITLPSEVVVAPLPRKTAENGEVLAQELFYCGKSSVISTPPLCLLLVDFLMSCCPGSGEVGAGAGCGRTDGERVGTGAAPCAGEAWSSTGFF